MPCLSLCLCVLLNLTFSPCATACHFHSVASSFPSLSVKGRDLSQHPGPTIPSPGPRPCLFDLTRPLGAAHQRLPPKSFPALLEDNFGYANRQCSSKANGADIVYCYPLRTSMRASIHRSRCPHAASCLDSHYLLIAQVSSIYLAMPHAMSAVCVGHPSFTGTWLSPRHARDSFSLPPHRPPIPLAAHQSLHGYRSRDPPLPAFVPSPEPNYLMAMSAKRPTCCGTAHTDVHVLFLHSRQLFSDSVNSFNPSLELGLYLDSSFCILF